MYLLDKLKLTLWFGFMPETLNSDVLLLSKIEIHKNDSTTLSAIESFSLKFDTQEL